jgi:hypothetical protein
MLASTKSLSIREASIVAVGVLDFTRMEETTNITIVEMGMSTTRQMVTTMMAIRVTTTTLEEEMVTIIEASMVTTMTTTLRRKI